MAQGKFREETRGLSERFLAISIRNSGPDGPDVAAGNFQLGGYYYQLAGEQLTVDLKRRHLLSAKSYTRRYTALVIQMQLMLQLIWLLFQVSLLEFPWLNLGLDHHLIVIPNDSICSLFIVGS